MIQNIKKYLFIIPVFFLTFCTGRMGSDSATLNPGSHHAAALPTKVPTIALGCRTPRRANVFEPQWTVNRMSVTPLDGRKIDLAAGSHWAAPAPSVDGGVNFTPEPAHSKPVVPDGAQCYEVNTLAPPSTLIKAQKLRIPLRPFLMPVDPGTKAPKEAHQLPALQPPNPYKIWDTGIANFYVTSSVEKKVTSEEISRLFPLSSESKATWINLLVTAGAYKLDQKGQKKNWDSIVFRGYFWGGPRYGISMPKFDEKARTEYKYQLMPIKEALPMLQGMPVWDVTNEDVFDGMDADLLKWMPDNFAGFAHFTPIPSPPGCADKTKIFFEIILPLDPFAPVYL